MDMENLDAYSKGSQVTLRAYASPFQDYPQNSQQTYLSSFLQCMMTLSRFDNPDIIEWLSTTHYTDSYDCK